jgi:spermidine synthase
VLLKLIFFSGLAFLLVPWLVSSLGSQALLRWRETYNIYSLLAWWIPAVAVLVLPLAVLGMASPFLMKIYSLQNPHFGRVSGGISFAFTVGSILGVYLPTFWLIPSYGTRATVMVFAAPLVLLGIFGWKQTAPKALFIILAAGTAALASLSPILPSFPDLRILAQEESPYNFIRVAEDTVGNRYMMFNAGLGIQSIYSPTEKLIGLYYDYYNLLPAFFPDKAKVKVLVLGLAGGTIPRQYQYFFGERAELTAVEIDPEAIELARQYFDLASAKIDVVNEDARIFLQTDQRHYDIIIVDAFQNEFEIPWTLTTEEFWRLVRARLTEDGIMAMNLIGRRQDDPLGERLSTRRQKFLRMFTWRISGKGRRRTS